VAGNWTQIASNLVADPPVNTWTHPAPASAMELYRVSPFSNERMISLFDFEEGTDGWVASAASVSVTNSDVVATTGSNSLAVTVGSTDFWKVNWTAGYDTNNPTFVSIRNALLDTTETWYLAVDFIYHGPSINATNSTPPGYYNQQVAFNSDTGGWVDNPNIALLEGGPIAALGTNTIVVTWSYELLDTGWGTTTNSYYQMNIGLSADFANMSAATLHYDNFRLTNKQP
jgi:hypothetical protein